MKLNVCVINNKKYYLLKEIEINGNSYLYLSNVDDEDDFMIRKRNKNNPNVLSGLDDEKEFKMASLVMANQVLESIN